MEFTQPYTYLFLLDPRVGTVYAQRQCVCVFPASPAYEGGWNSVRSSSANPSSGIWKTSTQSSSESLSVCLTLFVNNTFIQERNNKKRHDSPSYEYIHIISHHFHDTSQEKVIIYFLHLKMI